MVRYEQECGAAAGRGAYTSAQQATAVIQRVRQKLAKLLHASSDRTIALLPNGTAALNLALAGFLRAGDHVVTTAAEHNSLLRPLAYLQQSLGISFSIVPTDARGVVALDPLRRAMTPRTTLIAITHASNVTGGCQPLAEVANLAREQGVRLLVDAAQTLGYLPLDVEVLGIDLLAAPGHKGAAGPLGTGLLYAHPSVSERLVNPWPGGTGTDSQSLTGPFPWPQGFEAGNLNVPAMAGWEAGLDWLLETPIEQRASSLAAMRSRLWSILKEAALAEVVGDDEAPQSAPVISLITRGIPCSDAAAILDSSFHIETRSGLHCAPLVHPCIGSQPYGGTLRFSLGHRSTADDLDGLREALDSLRTAGLGW